MGDGVSRMTQLILGLGNKARQGKDSFVDAVEAHYLRQLAAANMHGLSKFKGIKIQKLSFADALYKEVNAWLKANPAWAKLPGAQWVSPDNIVFALPDWVQPTPNAEVSPRAPYGKHSLLLQWWGTDYRRAQNPNYWVEQWAKALDPTADIVMTPDMRFINEALMVKAKGGYAIRVSRLNADGTPYVDKTRDPNHRSETELDDFNFDYRITVKSGEMALLDEWAISLVYYLRGLAKKGK